jgi:glutathione peroxidase
VKSGLKFLLFLGASLLGMVTARAEPGNSDKTAYNFSFKTLAGEEPLPLSAYKGKVILVVNTASKCGFTKQYKGLEALYNKYKDKGLVIVGVPSNDFGNQEPGSASEIKKFCEINYGVTFPMTSKNEVTGENAHPFYKYAADVFGFAGTPKWNFHKYLVDRNGKLVDYFSTMTDPMSDTISAAIEKLL